jgi:hypothetical protein
VSKPWFQDGTLVKGDLFVGSSIFAFRTLRDAKRAYRNGSDVFLSSYPPMVVLATLRVELTNGDLANMVQVLTTMGVFWTFETSLVFWHTGAKL